MWQITQRISRVEQSTIRRADNAHLRDITCKAGLFMVSSRRPALVATAGLTSSTAVRKQQKACAREYFSRWFLVTEWISRNLQITATFSTAMSKAENKKNWHLFRRSEKWAHREKANSGPPYTDVKYQKEILMPPSWVFHFIRAAETISTQCSIFLPGSLDLVLGFLFFSF